VIDFTSALYLGLRHPSGVLQPWDELTTGVPAALGEPVEAREMAVWLARLQGFAAGALAPSTLHLAWDVFGFLTHEPLTVHMDAGAYAISRWGAARATLRGMRVREFRHHDVGALRAQIEDDSGATRPVVVTDGFCPACGRPAPLADYLECVRRGGGWLFTDDTQAFGILGRTPSPDFPYGQGGGGSFQWRNVHGPDVIVIASLAKAFGVPIAVMAGSSELIDSFKSHSDTRVHCSPPSAAVVSAASHALACNRVTGDQRRARLERRVRQFRRGLAAHGVATAGGLFPVQTLAMPDVSAATRFQERLRRRGVAAVLIRGDDGHPRLSFLITVRHTPQEIDEAVGAIAEVARRNDSLYAHAQGHARQDNGAGTPPPRYADQTRRGAATSWSK
jgi:8-amino-7-oxononanoate synthase